MAQELVDQIVGQLNILDWPATDVFAAHLALEEAVVNAVEHGNCCDASKQVHVLAEITPQRLWVRITDEGKGFDPCKLPDPTDSDHLCEPHGRGVLLMRRLMSCVNFNDRGNEVTLEKARSEAE
jgi:serine/threonine-protein kinase RsbW